MAELNAEVNAEVNAEAQEQTQGIEQVNTAAAQMDQVTQSNAANAEQSAAASEELSAQAKELDDMVSVLKQIVGCGNGNGNGNWNGKMRNGVSHTAKRTPANGSAVSGQNGNGSSPKPAEFAGAPVNGASAEESIPFGDEELGNF